MTRHTDAPGTAPDDDRASETEPEPEPEREHTESEPDRTEPDVDAVQMIDDSGTDVVHYSSGEPDAWVRVDQSDLVALGEML